MPACPTGTLQQQVMQQYSYLFQMAQQLNLALEQLEQTRGGVRPGNAPAAYEDAPMATSGLDEALAHLDARFSETLLKLIDRSGKKDAEVRQTYKVSGVGTPMASIRSPLSRIPAVSASRSSTPPTSTCSSTVSRVVPAMSVTMARS